MKTHATVTADQVIGPLPDFTAIIVAKAGGKSFPLVTSVHEAQVFSTSLAGVSGSPYEFMSTIVGSMGGVITHTEIVCVDSKMYSNIFIEYKNNEGQSVRRKIASDNPMHAVTVGVTSSCEVRISNETLGRIKDCTQGFMELNESLTNEYGKSWPLPIIICKGHVLRTISEFLEEAMPNGKIIRK